MSATKPSKGVLHHLLEMPLLSSVSYSIAKNWIAGITIKDAISASELANSKGFGAIINYLGEELEDAKDVGRSVEEYKNLLDSIKTNNVDGCISVKLTQLGLNIDKELCRKNLEGIVKHAKRLKIFVWVDMEGSEFTSGTIDVYCSVFSKNKNLGLCVQSCLRRSLQDLRRLVKIGGKIRLVKGAYNEPAKIAFKSKEEIDHSYLKLMAHLFKNSGSIFSIATHDDKLVYKALELDRKYRKNIEFGMLKGIRDKLKLELVGAGYKVTEYIPYGEDWLPYSIRRIREKPSNLFLLFRSLISR